MIDFSYIHSNASNEGWVAFRLPSLVTFFHGAFCNAPAAKDFKTEWGWHRYLVDGKMFVAACQSGPEHGHLAGREIVSLKCDPALSELLRVQYPDIIAGFYCDKRHWISAFSDGCVPDNVLHDLCVRSYQLIFSKLTKKKQVEILSKSPSIPDDSTI